MTQHVHLLLVEPVFVNDRASQKGANHIIQPRPFRAKSTRRQPNEADVPAVACRQPDHQLAESIAKQREAKQKQTLLPDALPVHEDQREYAPDGDVVEAGVSQDALADGLAENVEFFHEQNQDGQRSNRTSHSYPHDKLPGHRPGANPALVHQHARGGNTAEYEWGYKG